MSVICDRRSTRHGERRVGQAVEPFAGVLIAHLADVSEEERMLFEVRMTMTVDAIDYDQVEIIALGALQAAKAHVNSQAATVAGSSANVTSLED
jgi:hypothetical protein